MENSDIKEVKKDLTRIDIICDELLELETSKRVKKIKDGLLKIKEIVKVYDGDTITVVLDLGFGISKKEIIRCVE